MPRDAKTRRPQGQGSKIITRADGRKAAFITSGYRDGKQVKQWVYGKSEREVVQKLNKIAARSSSEVLPSVERLTLSTWLERYAVERGRDRSESTRVKYQSYLRHVAPTIGAVFLNRLDTLKVRGFLSNLAEKGLSPSSRQHIFDFLNSALEDAVNVDLIVKNPMKKGDRPSGGRIRETGIWTVEEVRALLEASQGYGIEFVIQICLTLGLRIGEALGLKWTDLKRNSLEVQRTLNRERGGERFRPCKKGSSRVLALDNATLEAFEEQRKKQNLQRAKAQEAGLWQEFGLIFASEVGTPLTPRNATRAFDAIVKRANIKRFSSHTMRKTYASMAALLITPKEIQERLGHKDIRMTMDIYTHVMQSRNRATAISLEKLLTPYDTLEAGES